MSTILCIATEWFSRNGGLSTFNRLLCIHLAKQHKVYCYLPTFDEEEYKHAQSLGVILIKPRKFPGLTSEVCMVNKPKLPATATIDILIGHDRKTGPIMEVLQSEFYPAAKSILFIHVNPSEIEWFKPEKKDADPAREGEEREIIHKDLGRKSSLIVAVGPKLYNDVNTYMAGIDHPPVIRFDPGLYLPVEQISYSFSWPNPESLVMGRLEDFHLKGVDIAFKAMTKVYEQWSQDLIDRFGKPNLILRGSVQGKAIELSEKLNGLAPLSRTPYLIRNYTPDEEVLVEDIRRAAITLMPSRTEGFGLVALEAISQGRPILIGHDTGFATLIREIAPEEAEHWIARTDEPDDGVEIWAKKIRAIFLDRAAAGGRLKRFVEKYAAKISWEKSVASLIESINNQFKMVYFDSNKADTSYLNCFGLQLWDNQVNAPVGLAAVASFQFDQGVIKVERKNADGRNLIDIVKYKAKSGHIDVIAHLEPPKIERLIRIRFEARVVGDPVNIFVVLHKYKVHEWLRYGWVQIEKKEWQECVVFRRVPSDIDITVQIQEKDFGGNTATYEIRNFLVEEWTGGLAEGVKDRVILDGFTIERHIGFKQRDILENFTLTEKSRFTVKIKLHQPDQKFIIYLETITSDGKPIWLGFSGGYGSTPEKTKDEYTQHRRHSGHEVVLQENIMEVFKTGFPELKSHPVTVRHVRLRASDEDLTEITFAYQIEDR